MAKRLSEPVPTSDTNGINNVTYQYKVKGADDTTYSDTLPINAGDYTVKATFAATDNYNEVTAEAISPLQRLLLQSLSRPLRLPLPAAARLS